MWMFIVPDRENREFTKDFLVFVADFQLGISQYGDELIPPDDGDKNVLFLC